jgi:hypothetical protein
VELMNELESEMKTLIGIAGGVLSFLLLAPATSAGSHPKHPYRYSVVDMPVSLAVGTVRTPEFAPPSHWYWILLQVEKPLPFQQMKCMIGVIASGPLDSKDCSSNDPLLRADWTVLNDGQVVYHGSSSGFEGGMFTKDYIFRFLGSFSTQPGKTYVVEVKFTKDGTPLNVANPHLIVIKQGDE